MKDRKRVEEVWDQKVKEAKKKQMDQGLGSDNRSSQSSQPRGDLLALIGWQQKSYSIFHQVSLLLTKISSGQPSSLKDLRRLAQEVEDFSKVVKVYRLLEEVRSIRNTGSLSLTKPIAGSSDLTKSYKTLPWILSELYKEATMLGVESFQEASDVKDVRSSLSDLIGSVLGAEGKLQITKELQGNQEIQVLDSGFEVRYNLSNDKGVDERDHMADLKNDMTDQDDDEFGNWLSDGGQKLSDKILEGNQETFERVVKATLNGAITVDDLVTITSALDLGNTTPKQLASWAMRWVNWDALEREMKDFLKITLVTLDRHPSDGGPKDGVEMLKMNQRLYIQCRVMEKMIWHRWDADGDADHPGEDRGRWVIKALEDYEAGGGSLIEEGDEIGTGWDLAFAKAWDCNGDEVFAELREVFSIAAALLWGE